jgi:nicotinamidase-related amidase
MKALLIIDMQRCYEAARDEETQKNIEEQIKKFKKEELPIIFVEYTHYREGYGTCRTLPCLTSLVKNYGKAFVVTKYDDDGATELYTFFTQINLDYCGGWEARIKEIVVCGVNLNACVKETIDSLSELMPKTKMTVMKECCNSNAYDWDECVEEFEQICLGNNVVLV